MITGTVEVVPMIVVNWNLGLLVKDLAYF